MGAVRVSLVVPVLNEARNLERVLPAIPPLVDELIVVDGGSADASASVARDLCPDAIVVAQPGRGKGDALACGLAAASGDVVVMMDADGSNDPAEIEAFVDAIATGADYAKGSRFIAGGGSSDLTVMRRLGNRLLRGLVNVLYGVRYTDLCYGFNAVRAARAPQFDVAWEGFEVEALLSCQAARARLTVVEVPSFESRRVHGSSNLRPLRDGLRILWIILRERVRPRPERARERPSEGRSGPPSPPPPSAPPAVVRR